MRETCVDAWICVSCALFLSASVHDRLEVSIHTLVKKESRRAFCPLEGRRADQNEQKRKCHSQHKPKPKPKQKKGGGLSKGHSTKKKKKRKKKKKKKGRASPVNLLCRRFPREEGEREQLCVAWLERRRNKKKKKNEREKLLGMLRPLSFHKLTNKQTSRQAQGALR